MIKKVMKKYEQHPLGAAWNMLDEAAMVALVDDIAENGIRESLTLYEGKILDGWQRYTACIALNIVKIPFVEYEGDDPAGYVLSKNLHRRHATQSQIAMAIARMAEEWAKSGRPSKSLEKAQKGGNVAAFSVADAAEKAGVSERTMRDAKAATSAIEEVQQAVMEGDLPVHKAAKLAKEAPEKQREAVAKAKAPKEKKERAAPRETVPAEQYEELLQKYHEVVEQNDTLASELRIAQQELDAVEAVRNGDGVQELKKLQAALRSMTEARDQWMNKAGELTKQLNYLQRKSK